MAKRPTIDSDAQRGVDFLRRSMETEGDNRNLALTDLLFVHGDQWPKYAIASRGLDRPQLTINELAAYVRQVTNNQKQQRPRMKAQPVNNGADIKIAKVLTGLFRHIQVNSNADTAYDTAFAYGAKMGWGYWRLRHDYIDEESFDQEIYIDTIHNPFAVYFDPNSVLLDGSDAEECLITDMMPKSDFERLYPGARAIDFSERGTGDSKALWFTKDQIRVAEFFWLDRVKEKLVHMSDGSCFFESEMPPPEVLEIAKITVIGDRESFKRKVKWCKQTGVEVLETKDMPGRWIPVVPFIWEQNWIDGKRVIKGMVRDAIDAQRMINFWQTALTESLAMAPKAKWLIAEGQDEGHENEWNTANISPKATLRYKQRDINDEPAPPPQRLSPEPPPAGIIEAAMASNQNLQRIIGMFDPAARAQIDKSGVAINAERAQAENSNFHGYDNLTVSMRHTGKILLSWIPKIYDTQRIQRIIGEDGTEEMITLNERVMDEQAIEKIRNDVRVGTYDVVMETGPGYDTKRMEGVDAMMQLLATPLGQQVGTVGGDLVVRNMDFPGADILADRLAAANPMSQIDDQSEVPPQAQMVIKQLQQQLQQAQEQMQAMSLEHKYKTDIEQGWMDVEREKYRGANAAKVHDTQTRAITAQNVEEIRATAGLMEKHIDTRNLEQQIEQKNAEQEASAQAANKDIERIEKEPESGRDEFGITQ